MDVSFMQLIRFTIVDDKLLDAAVSVLTEHGFDGVTLERVAEAAGSSRVTLWRQGVTKETLVDGLLRRLARDYRDALWPVLSAGPDSDGATRLEAALDALFEVADRHLALLAVSDEVFHWASGVTVDDLGGSVAFLDPVVVSLRAGKADGTLVVDGEVTDLADAVFNTACWGYVHLRARHKWSRKRARTNVKRVVLPGLLARPA
jgi:AcrR family transcriptional regulator